MGATKTECSECLEVFNGTEPFEAHRVGLYRKVRVCLTPAEMHASGKFVRGRWDRWELTDEG